MLKKDMCEGIRKSPLCPWHVYSPVHAQIHFCPVLCGLPSHVPSALIQTPLSDEEDSGTPTIGVNIYICYCQSHTNYMQVNLVARNEKSFSNESDSL